MLELIYIATSGMLLTYMYSVTLEEGMILERLGKWLNTGEKWKKPLGACAYCSVPYITILCGILYIFAYPIWCGVFPITLGFFLIALIDRYGML